MSKYQKVASFFVRVLAFAILWEYYFVMVRFYKNIVILAMPMLVLTFTILFLGLIIRSKHPSTWKANPLLATLGYVTGISIGLFLIITLFFF